MSKDIRIEKTNSVRREESNRDFAPKKGFGKLSELVESLRDDVVPF